MRGSVLRTAAATGVAALLSLLLTGCGGGSGGNAPASAAGNGGTGAGGTTLSGHLLAGSVPIAGASIRLYAAGAAAGAGPVLLAQATTDAQGAFDASIQCPGGQPSAPVYATATGGSAGAGGSNPAIALLAALGSCQAMPAAISIDELTTVAAAYALKIGRAHV